MSENSIFVWPSNSTADLEISDHISYSPVWDPKFRVLDERHQICIKTDAATAKKVYEINAYYFRNINGKSVKNEHGALCKISY